VGTGPAGLFCGLMLADWGYEPILLERGRDVEQRIRDVEAFWKGGRLDEESNVQFGEGGAGTFSDGKLNTLVKDKGGRNGEVLRRFVEAGADPSILYDYKPHMGTDTLARVVKNIRGQIEARGGTVRFGAKITGLMLEADCVRSLLVNGTQKIPCQAAVLALGHSARDTFWMLYEAGLAMEAKEFAVGLRVEHLQADINLSQYGMRETSPLQAAPYKIAARAGNGRSVYSFCMCPGGYVVNASSEAGRLCVNGMSYSGRSGPNANSAIVVSVGKDDFPSGHPLAGIAFQRSLEEAAYLAGGGKIPVQRLGDLRRSFAERYGRPTEGGQVADHLLQPCTKGAFAFCDLAGLLPRELTEAFLDGMGQFSHMIHGFGDDGVLVSGVESRTSSPVRILRDETGQSNLRGLYPCGEGAGYAGGITSAAMDGIRIAEAVAKKYRPFREQRK